MSTVLFRQYSFTMTELTFFFFLVLLENVVKHGPSQSVMVCLDKECRDY